MQDWASITAGLLLLAVMAIVVEFVWQRFKESWPDRMRVAEEAGWKFDTWGVLLLSVGVCILGGDRFDLLKIVFTDWDVPVMGNVMAGILISSGGSFVHDLKDAIYTLRFDGEPTIIIKDTEFEVLRETECAVCGVLMEWDNLYFVEGSHGEPACDKCKAKKEGDVDD